MASNNSAYFANKILDCALRATNITAPTNVYLALYSDAGSTELSGNNYSRINVTSKFGTAASGSSIANDASIQSATASGAWAAVAYVKLMDASSGGNILLGKAISLGALASGEFHNFAVGAVTFTE